jgi:gliding motility-associated-like protein
VTTYPTVLKTGIWYQSEFTVVSGNEPCDITIIPSADTETGTPAGTPIPVHLEPGEIYMVQAATGSGTDLTGSVIIADDGDDKFGVYNGHIWYYGGPCPGLDADPLLEVAYPVNTWGRDYVMTLTEEQDENWYRIIAKEDGTTFDLDGVPSGVTLDAGEVYDGVLTAEALLINANQPIGVLQTMLTGDCVGNGDPSVIMLNSNEQMYLDTIAFYAVDYNDIEANYANVVTRTDDIATIDFDGVPLGGWTTLAADPTYSYNIFEIDTGSHTLETTGCGFLAYTYGVKDAESYFYAAGVRLNSIEDTVAISNLSAEDLCDEDSILFTPLTSGGIVESYFWDFGDGETSTDESPIHVYDANGEYDVSLIVTYRCSADTIETTISVYNSPILEESFTNVSCFGYGDGSIETDISEGTPDFEYEWSNGETTPDISGLDAGTYTLIVTDENGCRDSITVEITEPPVIDISVDPAGPYDPADGIDFMSGSPGGGTWSADCGPCIDPSTGAFDPLVAGPGLWEICYTVEIEPCDTTQCIEVLVDTNCAMAVYFNEPTCHGFSDGSFTVNVSGGAGDVTFVLTDDEGNVVNVDNSNTANSLSSGWYYINVSDLVCVFEDSIFIGEPEPISAELIVNDPLCNGELTGFVEVDTVFNPADPYDELSFYWAPLPAGNTNGVGENSIENVGAGEYNLTINDANGCSHAIDFVVNEPPPLSFVELGTEPAQCRLFDYQSGNGVVFASANGGTPDYDYEWLNLADLSTTDNSTWGGLNPGVYKITVTDNNGCELIEFVDLDSINPIADFDVNSLQLNEDLQGTAVVDANFVNQSSNFASESDPFSDTTFYWYFDLPPNDWVLSQDFYETFDRSYTDSGTYNVCLVAINKNGCVDTTCKDLLIFDFPELITPNVFTPNGDDQNDLFFFPNVAIEEFNCIVVNRWGVKVFEFTEVTQGWDGNDLNGDPCTTGVYFYTYKATATNGTVFEGQGNIQILR